MPVKNSIKNYAENSYYHIYNRGVEKRPIYLDEQDYAVFLNYLKEYLSPKHEIDLRQKLTERDLSSQEQRNLNDKLRLNNFDNEIILLAYCLMPNHFHLFLKQNSPASISKFMKSVGTRYTMYFNAKYHRTGTLYEGVYKAVLITEDSQFVHLSRYIHKQAVTLRQPCSYSEYLGLKKTPWVHPEEILARFSGNNGLRSYKEFVEDGKIDSGSVLRNLTLEL